MSCTRQGPLLPQKVGRADCGTSGGTRFFSDRTPALDGTASCRSWYKAICIQGSPTLWLPVQGWDWSQRADFKPTSGGDDDMGYTTNFEGFFSLTPRLSPEQVRYIRAFSDVTNRRARLVNAALESAPDPIRTAVGLPIGDEGAYFIGEKSPGCPGTAMPRQIIFPPRPPAGQPGSWCQWVPSADGTVIKWDGGEKFYLYVEWLEYLLNHFLKRWGILMEGKVDWSGEDVKDVGQITVKNNIVYVTRGQQAPLNFKPDLTEEEEGMTKKLNDNDQANETKLVNWLTKITEGLLEPAGFEPLWVRKYEDDPWFVQTLVHKHQHKFSDVTIAVHYWREDSAVEMFNEIGVAMFEALPPYKFRRRLVGMLKSMAEHGLGEEEAPKQPTVHTAPGSGFAAPGNA